MKVIDHRQIPEDRLSTTDEKGWRVYLFPAAVRGFWRTRRTWLQVFLISIFLIGPWIQVGGHQMILLDIPHRQFALFGLTFWAHDTPILFFVFLLLTMGLAFITAIWGRVWCGWACPQTVFIDGVFRRIERVIIGNHLEQAQLARAAWSIKKAAKVFLKWAAFAVVGLIISHSFLAYFVGSHHLPQMITSDPRENWVAFLVMAFVSVAIIFDFGWFREQFCIIMCPYGRIQSVLMDRNSLGVAYDEKRGEPRGKKTDSSAKGDCVDCFKCVSACPTGIDIRRGLQMECIACTACVDACDEVMEKVGRPRGLIRYASQSELEGKKRRVVSPRLFVYLALLTFGFVGLVWAVSTRSPYDATILLGHDKPYQEMGDGTTDVLNHFKLNLKNHLFEESDVRFELINAEGFQLVSPINPVHLKPGELQRVTFFVKFAAEKTKGMGKVRVTVRFTSNQNAVVEKELSLVGPF